MKHFKHKGLYTDFYELTMAQGYFLQNKHYQEATFDYFFRKNPFDGGYVVFAGLWELLRELKHFRYGQKELEFLKQQGFHDDFLSYLEDFRFRGDIISCREGEIIFPLEPVMQVTGNIIETQLVESMLLNILNFSSLIATKAIRIRQEAKDRIFVDFGLRRAQGFGSLLAARAAAIGGINSTSNVLAAAQYGIPVSGTMAHSWVPSFDSELEAFRAFAEIFPDNCVLLIDTYDTLQSGLKNAIIVGRELEEKGYKLKGLRLDSGDLAYLSKKVRKTLEKEKLDYVKLVASNQLDEYLIRSLNLQNAPLDVFGVGTNLVTGAGDAALDGVYKMSEYAGKPRLKLSENIKKLSLPGKKNIIRYFDKENYFYGDAVTLRDEKHVDMMIHPYHKEKTCDFDGYKAEYLLTSVMEKGVNKIETDRLEEISKYAAMRLNQLEDPVKRLENPHIYKVGLSEKLMQLRDSIAFEKQKNFE